MAQKVGMTLTSADKLLIGAHSEKLFLYTDLEKDVPLGILKIGVKKLFYQDGTQWLELTPLCVLDFYVNELAQRKGIGKLLFDFMLQVFFHFYFSFYIPKTLKISQKVGNEESA